LEVRFVFRFFLCSYNCCIFFIFCLFLISPCTWQIHLGNLIFDISMYMANWFTWNFVSSLKELSTLILFLTA
jgi:hypothetical protein